MPLAPSDVHCPPSGLPAGTRGWFATVAAVGVVAYSELSFVYTIFIASQWLPEWAPSDSNLFQIAMGFLMAAITAGLALWTRRSTAAAV